MGGKRGINHLGLFQFPATGKALTVTGDGFSRDRDAGTPSGVLFPVGRRPVVSLALNHGLMAVTPSE